MQGRAPGLTGELDRGEGLQGSKGPGSDAHREAWRGTHVQGQCSPEKSSESPPTRKVLCHQARPIAISVWNVFKAGVTNCHCGYLKTQ